MKLSQYKNEEALEVLANIIKPVTEILKDQKIARLFTGKANKMEVIEVLLKDHKTSVVKVMAALNNVPYEEYEFNIISGTKQLLDILNDEELVSFFQSQGEMTSAASFGSAMASTEEEEA